MSTPTNEQSTTTRSWLSRSRTTLWTGSLRDDRCRWQVDNNTPWPVCVHGEHSRIFALAPFERRLQRTDPRQQFRLQRLIDRGKISVDEPGPRQDLTVVHALRIVVVLTFLWLVSGALVADAVWVWTGGALGVLSAVVLFCLLTRPGRLSDVRRVQRWTWQSVTMAVVVVIAVVGPALALWFGTTLYQTVRLGTDDGLIRTDQPLELLGRVLQLTLIAVASLLPALMFFQFDAERLSTLRDRWMQNIFRLDPSVSTVTDVEAKYGRQLEEAYGSKSDGRGRLTRGRRSPLIVATVVLTFGWLLILINATVRVGPPDSPDALPFTQLLAPVASPIAYAFLGAYFFALNLVHNSYVRGDLRPKTYNLITARVLVVVILAWLLQVAFPSAADSRVVYALAFAAGLVPRTVLHLALEKLPLKRRIGDVTGTGDALVTLDGIDLYERTRLSDEGVTTLQALANHDLVDLFFKTRISAARLVDWVDQATLQVYVSNATAGGPADLVDAVEALRRLSIRTATEFLVATDPGQPADRRAGTDVVAAAFGWEATETPARVALLRNALVTSEWAERILYWKGSRLTAADACDRLYVNDEGDLVEGDPRFGLSATSRTTADRMSATMAAWMRTADARLAAADSVRTPLPPAPAQRTTESDTATPAAGHGGGSDGRVDPQPG